MGTQDYILKGTKLVANIKKQRLIEQRLDSQKYNVKNTNKINHKFF